VKDEKKLAIVNLGLRELTEDDLLEISETVHSFIHTTLEKRVAPATVKNYEIIVDVNYNTGKELIINAELLLTRPQRQKAEEEVIQKILEETFANLDQWLKENFSQ